MAAFAPSLSLAWKSEINYPVIFMKNSFFSDDLADAAQGSYGSSSRMLLEAASPFSSLLVELVDKKVFFTHPHHFLWPLT